MKVSVEQQGLNAIIQTASALNGSIQPLMADLAQQIHTSVWLNFTQQRSPDGVPWLPSRAAIAENRKTLIDTGRLISGIDYFADGNTAVVGTNVPYAEKMHFGNVDFGSALFEGRPFLGIRDADEPKLLQAVADYFEGIFA